MKLIVANWKSNKTTPEAKEWLQEIFNFQFSIFNLKIILAASFIHLPILKESITPKSNISLAAQNVSPFPSGPYTGEVSAEMLTGLVDYVILGHSERRRYFRETNEMVAKKAKQVLEYKISPIICLDEPYIESQIATLTNCCVEESIFAYEPLLAIGSGKPDNPERVNKISKRIKKLTNNAPVLYGGSVNAKNAKKIIQENYIDGLLVGNASLNPKEFTKIVRSA